MIDKQSANELLLITDHNRIDYVPLYRNGIARGSLCVGTDEPTRKRKRPTKRGSHTEATGPHVLFRDIHTLWFVHDGKPYSAQTAPVVILKEAVTAFIHDDMAHGLLKQNHLDIVSRWYVLCEAKEMKLYRSKVEAERSLQIE